ncbi:MAG: ABC transporter substrate-binding protein [Armatimonadota bacterium]
MEKSVTVIVLCCFVAAALTGCSRPAPQPVHPSPSTPEAASQDGWPRTLANESGPDIALRKPAERVICLQPNISEMMAAVGAAEAVVGVDKYTDYPAEMTEKPRVGDILKPDYEKIVSLNPDLVVTSRGTPMPVIEKLRGLGVQVVGLDPLSIDEVFDAMKLLGRATGHEDDAEKAVQELQKRREAIRQRVKNAVVDKDRPRVVFILSFEPLFVAGASSFVAELINEAGGRHVIEVTDPAGEQQPWPQVSKETIIAAAPDVLICGLSHGGASMGTEQVMQRLRSDRAWSEIPAVRNGRVYTINDDIVSRPGPRLIRALEIMARDIHPEISVSGEGGEQ